MMTLITGLSGDAWAAAADSLSLPYLNTVVIGMPEYQDLYCDWQEAREVAEDGAILVRPDGYIAWRSLAGAASPAEAEQLLRDALAAALSTDVSSSRGENYRPNFGPHLFG
jgi:2,4-dichlorophenol 6-monooxygenase